MGATCLLLVPAVVNEHTRYEDAYHRSQKNIRRIIPTAKELNVPIAVENVWNNFLLSPMEFARYVDEFDSPFVRAYFDVGNVVAFGYLRLDSNAWQANISRSCQGLQEGYARVEKPTRRKRGLD